MNREPYQLLCSYVKNKYFISTAYRKASTIEPMWYFETIVWEWDSKTRKRGKMLDMEDSGSWEDVAFKNHFKLIENLHKKSIKE